MRGLFGFGFGRPARRNDPIRLADPHPVADYNAATPLTTGNAGRDGYSVLSRANPAAQGNPPPVPGTYGPAHQGPDDSFEQ